MSKNLMYCRSILKKVSFNPALFSKELIKAYGFLSPEERPALTKWVIKFIEKREELKSLTLSNKLTIIWG